MDPIESLSREELVLLLRDLLLVNGEQQARIVRLEEELARLRGGPPASSPPREPPAFVKPNRKRRDAQEPKPPRKRRPHGFVRLREPPTRVVEHFPACCSECGRKLYGGWLHASRQVIEIPVVPVEIIEHRFMARHCGVCDRREFARPDLSGQVWGQNRLGIRTMSLIGYLDTVCRMPLRTIQSLLGGLHGLSVSQGEIVRVLHTLAQAGQSTYEGLLLGVRKSKVVHADESGAREDGQNGQVWSLSTQDIRYYHRDQSRGAKVIQTLLGHEPAVYQARTAKAVREAREQTRKQKGSQSPRFSGKLVTDFYSAYSWYPGWHQCCLVHLDRDLDELRAQNQEDPGVCAWVQRALDLLHRAKEYARAQNEQPTDTGQERRRQRHLFEREAEELARPYCRSALPQRTLAERIRKHQSQLFVFVEHPEVPPDNNAAERSIRPFVVLRKVSGGTRSPAGSHTQAVLLSLFGTWLLRGQDALAACQQMLTGATVPAPT
jgi:transposase